MKRCQFCAEEIQDQAVVCKHCGRALDGSSDQAEESGFKSASALFVGLFLGFVVLSIGGCLFCGGLTLLGAV